MRNKKVYNPSDKGKRKYVSSMRNRILAGLIAAVTADVITGEAAVTAAISRIC